jgi:uncharacterized protein (TIGR00297 family)
MISGFSWSPGSDPVRWLLALVGALLITVAAYHLRALDTSGVIAAVLLGTVVVGAAGWSAGLLLVSFFVSSSLLSRIGKDRVSVCAARGSRRDAIQVFANGGIALLSAVGFWHFSHPAWLLALAGSLAAANADTWSTEIGRTSRNLPRLITTGSRVSPGTSGAVSTRGLVAAASGAAFIGTLASLGSAAGWFPASDSWLLTLASVGISGLAGSIADSIVGATVQEQRWCDACQSQTERRTHQCGRPTRPISGVSWVSNDVVNLACVFLGSALAWGTGWIAL